MPKKAIGTNIKESTVSPNIVESIALTKNLFLEFFFILSTTFALTSEPNKYATRPAKTILGVEPKIISKACEFSKKSGAGRIIASLKIMAINIFKINPKTIIFLAFVYPYTSDNTSFIIYEIGNTKIPADTEKVPNFSSFEAKIFDSKKHTIKTIDKYKNIVE